MITTIAKEPLSTGKVDNIWYYFGRILAFIIVFEFVTAIAAAIRHRSWSKLFWRISFFAMFLSSAAGYVGGSWAGMISAAFVLLCAMIIVWSIIGKKVKAKEEAEANAHMEEIKDDPEKLKKEEEDKSNYKIKFIFMNIVYGILAIVFSYLIAQFIIQV